MEYTEDLLDSLDVDVLDRVLDEDDHELLVDCFTWEYHPYGASYWEEQCDGVRELDTFELNRILRHFNLRQKGLEVEVICTQPNPEVEVSWTQLDHEVEVAWTQLVNESSDLAPRRYLDLSDWVQQMHDTVGRST